MRSALSGSFTGFSHSLYGIREHIQFTTDYCGF